MTIPYKELEEFQTYIELEGSELGDLGVSLLELYQFRSYYLSTGFAEAVEKEIKEQLQNYRDNCSIVEEEITTTSTERRLEWYD